MNQLGKPFSLIVVGFSALFHHTTGAVPDQRRGEVASLSKMFLSVAVRLCPRIPAVPHGQNII